MKIKTTQRTPKLYLSFSSKRPSAIKSYTDIKSLGDALVGLGFDRNTKVTAIESLNALLLQDGPVNVLERIDILSAKAFIELSIINRAINKDYDTLEEWEPNWKNNNELKYYPLFSVSGGGFGFSDTTYGGTYALIGSRYKTKERAEHAGKTFVDLYKKLNKI